MMNHFRMLGYEVIAIGNEPVSSWCERFAKMGVRYLSADISRNGTNPFSDIRTFVSLHRILKQEAPDKIFVYQAKTVIYGSLAGKILGMKEIYPLIAGIGSIFLEDTFKTRILRFIMILEYKTALRKCPKIFFQNQDDVAVFRNHHLIKDCQIVMLHGSGVNLCKFEVLPQPEQISFIYIGRLIRDKGIYEYLEAAKVVKSRYPDTRCLLVGPFDSNPSALKAEDLQPFIDEGTIEYFGEQNDIRPFLMQAAVLVLPSYREGTPKSVLEAMACGRAVITTDAPGCRETVADGVNGYLVPVQDAGAVADRMIHLREHPELIESMAKAGRSMAEETFDVMKVNDVIAKAMCI